MNSKLSLKRIINSILFAGIIQILFLAVFLYSEYVIQERIRKLSETISTYVEVWTHVRLQLLELRAQTLFTEPDEINISLVTKTNDRLKEARILAMSVLAESELTTVDSQKIISLANSYWLMVDDYIHQKSSLLYISRGLSETTIELISIFDSMHRELSEKLKVEEEKQYILGVVFKSMLAILLAVYIMFFFIVKNKISKPLINACYMLEKEFYFQTKVKNIKTIFNELDSLFKRLSDVIEVNQEQKLYLDRLVKERSSFLTIMAHEIRTPVNVILGNLKLAILKFEKNPELSDALTASLVLKDLVEDNLSLTKLENLASVNKDECDIRSFSIKLASFLRERLITSNTSIHFFYAHDLPLYFWVDSKIIFQCMINILDNSLKNVGDYGILNIRFKIVDDELVISIFDNGTGMSEDVLKNATRPFSQGNAFKQGVGIGMYITSRLIRSINGVIRIRSREGIGTLVVIRVPNIKFYKEIKVEDVIENIKTHDRYTSRCLHKKISQPRRDEFVNRNIYNIFERANEEILGPFNYSDQNFKNTSILLVEDFVLNRKLISRIFDKIGVLHKTVESGEQALLLLEKHSFNLIIMDVQLPGISGVEVSKIIRNRGIETPIVGLSAFHEDEIIKSCYSNGMDYFMKKPFEIEELIYIIKKLK